MRNRILIPTNFSEQSNVALEQGIQFAEMIGADIGVLNVIEDSKINDDLIDTIQYKLDMLVNKLDTDVKIYQRIELGKILPTILTVEQEIKPSYLFIGLSRGSKYSTTYRLIEEVNCPVVIFPNRSDRVGCKNIVLPLDLSKETKQKIDQTIKIAKIYGATVNIVSATSFTDELECNKLKLQIEKVKCVFDKLEINCTTKLLKTTNDVETMANAINDYADDINADLIVIMIRQETRLQKFFVGSMSVKLIQKSTKPVLCIAPKNEK